MDIPMKYEDVVANLDAALGREAALREELANKCEIIKEFHASEILIRESLGRARHRRDEVIDERDTLQQRLTAAEQLAGDPVVMALPKRLPVRMPEGRNLPRGYAEAWNSCLDEVIRINGLKP